MTLVLLAIREFVVDACLVNKEFPRNFLIFEENLTKEGSFLSCDHKGLLKDFLKHYRNFGSMPLVRHLTSPTSH